MRECLLVDAYNLFHSARASSHARLFPDIKRLAFFLEHYASDSGSTVTFVIDGTRFSDEFVRTPVLRVLFSEAGQTADAVMEAWMARLAASERLNCVLVSNDLHLCRMGSGMGLRVRSCASVVEDLARFAAGSGRPSGPRGSARSFGKPFNNPFGRLASAAALWFIVALTSSAVHALEFSGFSRPDSVVSDPVSHEIFVSNAEPPMEGGSEPSAAAERERGGFISKISGNGLVLVQRFIQKGPEGSGRDLREPRGMAAAEGKLYVADGGYVRVYRTDTGAELKSIPVDAEPSAVLGSVVLGRKGELYAADAASGRVFKIDMRGDRAAVLWAQDEALRAVCGLAYDARNRQLLAVTRDSGRLLRVDSRGRTVVVREGLGPLSGMFVDPAGNVYLSSETRGEVYRIPDFGRGNLVLAAGNQPGAAGIGYEAASRSMLIALKPEGRLVSIPLPEKRSVGVAPKNVRT